jgi:adenine-specific DNA-methyltransferase
MKAIKTKHNLTKQHGIHYTPDDLASFLAEVTFAATGKFIGEICVLDPACGDGGLLKAIVNAAPEVIRNRIILTGYETDPEAITFAAKKLNGIGVSQINLFNRDFLAEEGLFKHDGGLFAEQHTPQYDIVIANPPYVRTQVMGAKAAKVLANRFGLTGRVDLYHAFAKCMADVLKPGGILGLLTSNRFLTIKSGASLRELFVADFDLEAIYDLGDTKLFVAAVLPAILVGRKGRTGVNKCSFRRIYEHRNDTNGTALKSDSPLQALRDDLAGVIETPKGSFCIEIGKLATDADTWSLASVHSDAWLGTINKHQVHTFGDLGKVRVGIKTTADEVFIRSEWDSLPMEQQPERQLLRPLLTHHVSDRWKAQPVEKHVLYPHTSKNGKRFPVDLKEFPKGAAYLRSHRERLTRRTYVIEGGREWYEIWVPHNPEDWDKPKIAYPDISEHPRFFFEDSGAIINGDCYWITLFDGVDQDWLLLMLAVANSTFITKFYDTVFHNKLYAGRRRFMTQYVSKFPLPDIKKSSAIVHEMRAVLKSGITDEAERKLNALVWHAFGLSEEIPWQRNL